MKNPSRGLGGSSIRVEASVLVFARLDSLASRGDCGALCGFRRRIVVSALVKRSLTGPVALSL